MIFVFIEDGTLDVIDSIEDALREYEGVDVENQVYSFYNKEGIYLKPVFTTPNKYSHSFFGFFKSVTSGVFTLIPHPNNNEDPIKTMLSETVFLNKNKFFDSLDDIRSKFSMATP